MAATAEYKVLVGDEKRIGELISVWSKEGFRPTHLSAAMGPKEVLIVVMMEKPIPVAR